jgi:DNA recombination protein RmuC
VLRGATLTNILLIATFLLLSLMLVLDLIRFRRKTSVDLSPIESALGSAEKAHERVERSVREEITKSRVEGSEAARHTREEMTGALKSVVDTLNQQLSSLTSTNDQKLDRVRETVEQQLRAIQQDNSQKLELVRQDSLSSAKSLRDELAASIKAFVSAAGGEHQTLRESITNGMSSAAEAQHRQLNVFGERLDVLTRNTDQNLLAMRTIIDEKMKAVQEDSARQLTDARDQAAVEARRLREEISGSSKLSSDTSTRTMTDIAVVQKGQLDVFSQQLVQLTSTNETTLTQTKNALEQRLASIQEQSEKRLDQMRLESSESATTVREEFTRALNTFTESVATRVTDLAGLQKLQLESMQTQLLNLTEGNERRIDGLRIAVDERLKSIQQDSSTKLDQLRVETGLASKDMRDAVNTSLKSFNDSVLKAMTSMSDTQKRDMETFTVQLGKLTESNSQGIEALKTAVEARLRSLQDDNTKQLDQMRQTVDEKLQGTLEKRLGESFKQVTERLELVHKGLGEMQTLATGVGDLKKIFTNVKARGTWGEVQLGALLEQVLTADQFGKNVATKGESERVEFAVKLPGGDPENGGIVWLPIDAKFPIEDYQRLVAAQDRSEPEAVEAASKQLETQIKGCAKSIHDKYVSPPRTTDFAILFLPTEGLFAEVLRRPGLADFVQREHRVVLAGPTTLWSILNSLQMGFRTLAIQQRSSEVWTVLAAVKTEWTKYGDVLRKVQKKLSEASTTLDTVEVRSRAVGKRLRAVEDLPIPEALTLPMGAESNAIRVSLSSFPPSDLVV